MVNFLRDDATFQPLNYAALTGNPPPVWATMYPSQSQGSGPWVVIDPFGNNILTSGTTSQGLDSLIAAAAANGWSWRVLGNGNIRTTAQITIPPALAKSEYIDVGVSIVSAGIGSASVFKVDSHENCYCRWLGQVVQNAADTGPCFNLVGSTADSAGNIGFAANYFEFPTSMTCGTTGIGAQIDLTLGGFNGNTVWLNDVNGGSIGLKVINPGTGFIAYENNKIFYGYVHGQTIGGAQIGQSNSNAGNMRFNTYIYGRIDPGSGCPTAVDTWERNCTHTGINILKETGTGAVTGLKLESGANNNIFTGGTVQAATTVLSDAGAGNTFLGVDGIKSRGSGLVTVLASTAVAVSHTGDLTDFTLATIAIPGNSMGLSGAIRVTTQWSMTNNANSKTLNIKYAGTAYLASTLASNASARIQSQWQNRNATNSQVGNSTIQGNFSGNANAAITTAVDSTADQNITLTGQLANAADTITLESYLVELILP
jgi:hypothetical protein